MDPIKLKKETIEIEGDRKLYNYTFEIDEDPETNQNMPHTGVGELETKQPEASE